VSLETPVRVLVVVDRQLVANTVALTLNHGVFVTRTVHNVFEAATLLKEWSPHLVVVDMDLGDGELLRQLGLSHADQRSSVPALGITRRGDLKTKLSAFAQGVDDIMTVPFSPEELLARALVITRRAHGSVPPLQSTIRLGQLEIDILNREVRAGTSTIHLTSIEQSLLYLLAANAGRVIERDEILDALWGVDFVTETNIVDRHIRALRLKLKDNYRRPRFIETVPRHGYRFITTFTDEPQSTA